MIKQLTDKTWPKFIKEGKKVLLVSLDQGGQKCPYCIKLAEKLTSLPHTTGEIIINNSTKLKKRFFTTLESGKSFPVLIVLENGTEKYRIAGDMPMPDLVKFIDTGVRPVPPVKPAPAAQPQNKPIEAMSIMEIESILYNQIKLLRQTETNINVLEQELARRLTPKL